MNNRPILIILLIAFILAIMYSSETFTAQDPVLNELKEQLAELHPKFKNVNIYAGNKSETINKNRVYICLKDDKGRYYSRNMLCYVILHEYAHLLCDELNHTDKFGQIFESLLSKAAEKGLYNPHIPPIQNYCGYT